MSVPRSVITGVGSYLPKKIVTNDDLSKIVDTSDEWIVERSGIRQRHMAEDGEKTSDLALAAAKAALANAGVDAQEIDLIIMVTTTVLPLICRRFVLALCLAYRPPTIFSRQGSSKMPS